MRHAAPFAAALLLSSLTVLGFSGIAAAQERLQEPQTFRNASCTVAFVDDGDSFNCRDGEKVRLLLTDAPEGGAFGDLARSALAALLPVDDTFRLEVDERARDKQGRLLAYVFLPDGQMVNELMVRQGYAFLKPDKTNRKYLGRLREAEAEARDTGRGLWAR